MRPQIALIGLAASVLMAGIVVYVIGRPPGTADFVPFAGSLWRGGVPVFASVSGSLPSFAHAFAFSVFSALSLPARRSWSIASCAAWLMIDGAFEVGQRPDIAQAIAARVPEWAAEGPPVKRVIRYLTQGTFDPLDLLAAVLGALAAYLVLAYFRQRARSTQGGGERCR